MNKSKRPNIVFLVSDQHNAKVTGYAGHQDVKTPYLDQLADQGVVFENMISQNPICTPSRTSFLSGQYCHNHGYYGLEGPHPADHGGGLPNFLAHFRQGGYRTSAIGKIHCPANWVEDSVDVFHETCDCSIGGRSPAYTKFLKTCNKEHLEDHGGMHEFPENKRQSMDARPSSLSFEESQEGWIASQTRDFIEQATESDVPFVAYASFPRPHQCTAPSQSFWDLYDSDTLTLPPNADYDLQKSHKAPHMIQTAQRWRGGHWALMEPRSFEAARRRKLHGYLGAISQVDHAVGQILDTLKRLQLDENTIVIYTSDHGDYATEHGIMEKAPGICSDAITRVPMLVRWADHCKAAHRVKQVTELIDIAPTLCALAGLEPMLTADGCDLSGLLTGGTENAFRPGITENAWSKSIRLGRHRLVYYPQAMFTADYPDGFGELYDLQEDPWEMHNLYFEPACAQTVMHLKDMLMDRLTTTTRVRTTQPRTVEDSLPYLTRYHGSLLPDGKITTHQVLHGSTLNYL